MDKISEKWETILQETLRSCEGKNYETICKIVDSLPCLTRVDERLWGDSFYLTQSQVDTWLHEDGRLFELMSDPTRNCVLGVNQAELKPNPEYEKVPE